MKHVAVAVISRENEEGKDEYLLIQSKKDFGEFTGFWYPPGGHVEGEETEIDTLIRELHEELKVVVNPIEKIAETKGDIPEQITHWWRCEAATKNLTINDDEIAGARWFTRDLMRNLDIWPATKEFFTTHIFDIEEKEPPQETPPPQEFPPAVQS